MSDDDKNETITSLLHTIALIREAAGVNEKPMLSELPDVIRKLREERDEARRDACEFGAMLETDADPNYDPESGKFAEIAMSIAHLKGWDCWSDYKKDI